MDCGTRCLALYLFISAALLTCHLTSACSGLGGAGGGGGEGGDGGGGPSHPGEQGGGRPADGGNQRGRSGDLNGDVGDGGDKSDGKDDSASSEKSQSEEEVNECKDKDLEPILQEIVEAKGDAPAEAALEIQNRCAEQFGGSFQGVVSDCDFGYANWYGGRICKLKVGDKWALAWQD